MSIRAQPVTIIKLPTRAVRKGHRGFSAAITSSGGGKMIDAAFFSRFVFLLRLHNARRKTRCCLRKHLLCYEVYGGSGGEKKKRETGTKQSILGVSLEVAHAPLPFDPILWL